MGQDGFVYVLSNESMAGLVKIGVTTKTPKERAFQLFSTGVPTPFNVECAVYFRDIHVVEGRLHEKFSYCRVSESREFFQIDVDVAVVAVLGIFAEQYGHSVVWDDLAIDVGDIEEYAERAGVHPFSVRTVLSLISPDEWKLAGETHREIVKIRRDEMEQNQRLPTTEFINAVPCLDPES